MLSCATGEGQHGGECNVLHPAIAAKRDGSDGSVGGTEHAGRVCLVSPAAQGWWQQDAWSQPGDTGRTWPRARLRLALAEGHTTMQRTRSKHLGDKPDKK